MPGYLTHAKVLIDTVDWLSDVEDKLQDRLSKKKPLTALEKAILDRARAARQLLRYKPGAIEAAPPERAADIKPTDKLSKAGKRTGVGHGISRYAFTGSLGVDFAGAANILAINQRWVYRTMHWGSPNIAWERAGSGAFIFAALDQILTLPGAAGSKPAPSAKQPVPGVAPLLATVLGHCSSVATHVLLHPFIAWAPQVFQAGSTSHAAIENALDAFLAVSFFERDDLHSGDSWTDYYLEDDKDWTPVLELYLQAFNQTYAGPGPADTMCALPSLADLKAKFAELEPLLTKFPGLDKSFGRYQGYGKLFDPLPALTAAVAKKEFDAAKALKDLLEDYRCRTPTLDRAFLDDGWRNTLKWAIDEGYDKGPALFRWTWATLLLAQGWYVTFKVVNGLNSSSTILETITFGAVKHPDSQAIGDESRDEWLASGITFDVVWDSLTASYDPGVANVFTAFNLFATGIPKVTDGAFGQGTAEWGDATTGEKAWKITKIIYKVLTIGTGEIWPKLTNALPFKIGDFVVSFVFDVLDVATFGAPDQAKGKEGDILGRELWFLQLMCWPFHFASCLLVLGAKSGRRDGNNDRETGYAFWDFLLGLMFPTLGIVLLVFWKKQIERRILGVAGVSWPTTDTAAIDPFVKPALGDPKGTMFDDRVRVMLFPDAALKPPAAASNVVHPDEKGARSYPADASGAVASKNLYHFPELFDRTKYLSGLLAMTAVKYFADSADAKKTTKKILDDWHLDCNLDFRSDTEWMTLMDSVGDAPGLLNATATWWDDVRADRQSERKVLNQLQKFFGVAQTTGKSAGVKLSLQYEDGTPMANASFEAVFGDMRVPGQTDDTGVAEIDAPADHGDSYQLFLLSYPQQQVVRSA